MKQFLLSLSRIIIVSIFQFEFGIFFLGKERQVPVTTAGANVLSDRSGHRQQQTPLREVRRRDQSERQEPHPRGVGRHHLSGIKPRLQTSQLQALRARRWQGQGGQQQ